MASAPQRTAQSQETSFERENARLFVRRLTFTLFLSLVFVGAVGLLGWALHPASGEQLLRGFALQVGVVAMGLGLCWLRPSPGFVQVVALVLVAHLLARLAGDATLFDSHADHLAVWYVCILTGTAVLVPWGGLSQAMVALVALGSFSWALSFLPPSPGTMLSILGFTAGAITSVFGARFLDQSRRSTFVQTARLHEEAEIGGALANVEQMLSADLSRPDMLEQVNQLAVELVGCDWSGTFTWHDRPRGYRLGSSFGLRADARTELGMLDFPAEVSPLLRALEPHRLVEVDGEDRNRFIPPHLRRRFDMGSALFAPLYRGIELAGVLVCAFRDPEHRFTERERRLMLGIAHATAIAHQNALLIHDLTAASRLKSDFVATMSHELRTPLNIILGYTDLLSAGDFGELSPAQRQVLATTRSSAQQLFELVSSTLNLNRMETGREPVELDVTNMDELLAEIVGESQPLVGAGVRLAYANQLDSSMVVTDRVKLKTIVKNLVGNALKFTERGSVEIVARAAHGQMIVEVRDTGIGIPEEQLPVIFEMFRQVDSSPTRRHDGVGLGLYIVKRLADLLGGSILVASKLGVGSTFTLTLPLTTAGYRIAS
jgi:signal transduction histidine kinase